jgi:hypothetical protein
MLYWRTVGTVVLAFLAPPPVAQAASTSSRPESPVLAPPASEPFAGSPCQAAIEAAEARLRIPQAFLAAIAKVESGRAMPGGKIAPWPWTINAAGHGYVYASKNAAMQAARVFQDGGNKSIDVGCLQVNLFYHPIAFASLEQAFDPVANADYAAGLLVDLFHQTGSWPLAAAAYHSATVSIGEPYEHKVLATWALPDPRLPFRAIDGAPAIADPSQPGAARAASVLAASAGQGRSPIALPAPPQGFVPPVPAKPSPLQGIAAQGRSLALYRAFPVRFAASPPRPRMIQAQSSSAARLR